MIASSHKFGEFELDCARYELRRNGQPLKLERIPMDLLILLIEKDGNVVTRQEIIERLWGKDVFVDTEHGINTAIRKIRLALKDDPEQPRFVQTVTGKGYRFIGQRLHGDVQMPSASLPGKVEVAREIAPHAEEVPKKTSRTRRYTATIAKILTLCLLVYIGFTIWRTRQQTNIKSSHIMLAVLPFENLSGDPNEEYFTDGLTEEIISQLGALSPDQLGVIARTSSMAYKHTTKSVQQIGQELSVDYLLESSVRRDGDQMRVTTQLIRTRDQVHVWSHSYDRHISGSIALQEEVAKAVASEIKVKLSPAYEERPVRAHRDSEANEAYLRGRYFWNQFTPDGYRKAITYFQQAIQRDPNFAEAYAGIADSYWFLEVTDSIAPAEASPKIWDAASQAVALGDALAESHCAMANAWWEKWDWQNAEKELKRGIGLNPNYSSMHRIYAALLEAQRRHGEARGEINEAMRTDPLSLPNNAEVVRTFYYARDYDGALAQSQKALQLDPDYYRTHFWTGRVYAQKHMYKEAIKEAEMVLRATPDSNLALTEMAYSLAAGGRQKEARTILQKLEQRAKTGFTPAYDLAVIHIALNENETAIKLLQQAYDEHDWAFMVVACEPRLDPLRKDARFQAIQKKVGFPPAS